jgi:outer membrane protein OmpA-like peptidoglycan-associated protein
VIFLADSIVRKHSDTIKITHIYKKIDTLFLQSRSIFDLNVIITATNSIGNKIKIDSNFSMSVVEQYASQEYKPILNKIFFEQGASKLPERYKTRNKNQATNYNMSDNTLEIYYDVLNIIGERMNNNKTYTLNIEGCNDNYSAAEKNNMELSSARATTIRNYLHNN